MSIFSEPERYSLTAVEKFIHEKLEPLGYECEILETGVLLDSIIAFPPNDQYYLFVFRETYQTSWSSVYTVEKYENITPELQEELDRRDAEYDEECA